MTRTASALWHPFADMSAVDDERFVVSRAEGPWVWDADGRRYLDACGSLWYANLGHGRPEVIAAITAQLQQLDAYSIFGDHANGPAMDLASRLAELMPGSGARVFLGSGGGDAIETAAKIARAHHAAQGAPERQHLIGRVGGYHGTHGFGTSIGGIPANSSAFGRLLASSHVPFDDAEALGAEIDRIGAANVAAFFCEPVIGAGGVLLAPDGYIERVAEICRDSGVLFVADCVICGFGRLGTWLGFERWDVRPDLVTLAKGITGGMLPVGAVIVTEAVAEPFFTSGPGAPVLRHGATYSGHPVCCAAANAALDVYERDGLIQRGRELEGPLATALAAPLPHPLVAEVRAGLGFLGAVELTPELLEAHPDAGLRLQKACRDEGILVRNLARGIAVSPPLVVDHAQIRQIGEAIAAALDGFEAKLGFGSASR